MKKVFIIVCNPKKESFSTAITNSYISGAKKTNNEIRLINVYTLEVNYFNFNAELTAELKEFQDNILWADELVFVYPVWHLSIPAKLKSIIEQTFQKDVVAKFSEKGYPIPLLKGKTATIIQTYDMPEFIMKYFGGDMPYNLIKGILNLCGIKVRKRFDFGQVISSSIQKRENWLKKIEKFASK